MQELRLAGDSLTEPVPLEKARWAIQQADTFVADTQRLLTEPKT